MENRGGNRYSRMLQMPTPKRDRLVAEIRERTMDALRESDISEILGPISNEKIGAPATAALKAVVAGEIAERAVSAMEVAKKKNLKLGAAAVIISGMATR
jgi:hypothetical protein